MKPDDIVNSKAAMWGELWQTTQTPTTLRWWEPLRRAAAQQGRDEVTEEQLDAAMCCFSRRVGLGADSQNPRWWRSLPSGASQHLITLIEAIEEELVWPTPMTLNVVQLIHKSVEADRPITLTQGLYRLWSRLRRKDVAAWTRQRAGHWDRAVAGSAPLREALLRQAKLELATVQQFSWVEVLWDLTKFYDFVDLRVVADVGLAQDYPIVCLALGLQMAAAPRRLRADQCVSGCMVPTRSLIAGCGQAVDFSRLALYEVLEHLHCRYRPLELSSWVDDLGHQEIGHTSSVASRAIGVSTELVTGLREKGFRMSSKSALLASSPGLGRTVQRALAAAGIEVQLSQHARDLGVDGHARRRSTKVLQARLRTAGRKAGVIKHLVKSDRLSADHLGPGGPGDITNYTEAIERPGGGHEWLSRPRRMLDNGHSPGPWRGG